VNSRRGSDTEGVMNREIPRCRVLQGQDHRVVEMLYFVCLGIVALISVVSSNISDKSFK